MRFLGLMFNNDKLKNRIKELEKKIDDLQREKDTLKMANAAFANFVKSGETLIKRYRIE